MKRRLLSCIAVMIMMVMLFPVQAMAYRPQSPGLWIEGVLYATDPNTGQYHEPTNVNYRDNAPKLQNLIENQSVIVDIPTNAKNIMFRYWDYGNPNGISFPNNGWITGGDAFSINGRTVNGQHTLLGYDCDTYISSGGKIQAIRHYITYRTDLFKKDNTDKFTVSVRRVVGSRVYNYEITYHIHWIKPRPDVSYDSLNHHLTKLNDQMEFRYSDENNKWGDWIQSSNIPTRSYNMYPSLSTSCSTKVEVRFIADPTDTVKSFTIPMLKPAQSGLYIGYHTDGRPVLWGLQKGHYYAWSQTREFEQYRYYGSAASSGGGVYLDGGFPIKPGDTIYVRTADNVSSASSAWIALTVPALPEKTNKSLDLKASPADSENGSSKSLVEDATGTMNIYKSESGLYDQMTTHPCDKVHSSISTTTYEDGTSMSIVLEDQ